MAKYAFFQGRIVPIDDAQVSIMNHTFNYGLGVFEGLRAYWNEAHEQLYVFKMREHYERFLHNCGLLLIALPYTVDDLERITLDLLRREGYRTDCYLRPLGYKASHGIGVRLHNLENAFALFADPFGRYVESEEGAKVGVSSWRRVDDNAIPARGKITGSYINSALAKTEANLNGFDEAIVLNQDGHVAEGSAANLFIVRQGKLITPPVTDNILEGITRQVVMELAHNEMGLETVERSIDRSELYMADEACFCGTGVQIVAIAQIDRRPIGTGKMGPVVSELRRLYFDIVRGNVAKYRHWCTPVYVTEPSAA